jgi:hypothetical protein
VRAISATARAIAKRTLERSRRRLRRSRIASASRASRKIATPPQPA